MNRLSLQDVTFMPFLGFKNVLEEYLKASRDINRSPGKGGIFVLYYFSTAQIGHLHPERDMWKQKYAS